MGRSTLREASEQARKLKEEVQTILRAELESAWIASSLQVDELEAKDYRWKEHIYFNQIPPAPMMKTLLCASDAIVNRPRLTTAATLVRSFLPPDRLFFVRLIEV